MIESLELDEKYLGFGKSVIASTTFYFRALTIKELAIAKNLDVDSASLEDHFVEIAVVYPEALNINKMKAGHVSQLADDILKFSGFEDLGVINALLDKHRAEFKTDIVRTMKSYIITAMPAYKEEELDHLTMDEFTSKVVLAEEIITLQQTVSGLETSGFRLVITAIDEEFEEYVEEEAHDIPVIKKPQPKKSSFKKQISKEEADKYRRSLISKIKAQNRELVNAHEHTGEQHDYNLLEEADITTLEGILGITTANDPIAGKLKAAMEGLRP